MKYLGRQSIPLSSIDVPERLRAFSPDHAAFLAESMKQNGLHSAIEVRPNGNRFILVIGRHRLGGAEILEWPEIVSDVYEMTTEEARLAEIDENLVRFELNALDRAINLAERKALYERLHPETVAGVAGGLARQGSANEIISFARDTAEKVGLTERTIQLAVSIAANLSPAIRSRIAGSPLAYNQSQLRALAKIPADQQGAVVDSIISGRTPTIKAARDHVDGRPVEALTADQRQLNALLRAWKNASPSARSSFLSAINQKRGIGQ